MTAKAPPKNETVTVKSMRELLKDYEVRAERYGTTVPNSIRLSFKKATDDDRQMTRFVFDPQDRRPVDYWDDEKLIRFLSGDSSNIDSVTGRKKKAKPNRAFKEDKPLVKLLPLIESIRAKRYTNITELFVWECFVEYDDSLALSGLLSRGCYPLQRLELTDCFLDAKCAKILATSISKCRTVKEFCLDFNEIGDAGCIDLCTGLLEAKYLVHLSLNYCGLTKQSGPALGNLVARMPVRQLFLDGNQLEAEGVIALISKLAEAAEAECIERTDADLRKKLAEEEANKPDYGTLDFDPAKALEEMNQADDPDAPKAEETPAPETGKKGKKGKKGSKSEPPPAGPQISILKLADVGITHGGQNGNFAPVRCAELFRAMIADSKDLQELDLFGNEFGDLGARQLLEGLLSRKEAKLPQIGLRVGHRINQDTFDMINKLAPGPKKKKGKGKK